MVFGTSEQSCLTLDDCLEGLLVDSFFLFFTFFGSFNLLLFVLFFLTTFFIAANFESLSLTTGTSDDTSLFSSVMELWERILSFLLSEISGLSVLGLLPIVSFPDSGFYCHQQGILDLMLRHYQNLYL